MNESQISQLIKLAGEMVLGKAMPSEFASDWDLPKSTPRRARRKIEASAAAAHYQCREWSRRIMKIVDESRKQSKCS